MCEKTCNCGSKKELSDEMKSKLNAISTLLAFIETKGVQDYTITITNDGIKFKEGAVIEDIEESFNILREFIKKDKPTT